MPRQVIARSVDTTPKLCEEGSNCVPNSVMILINLDLSVNTTNLMVYETGISMPHSQELSNYPYLETNQHNSSYRYLFI